MTIYYTFIQFFSYINNLPNKRLFNIVFDEMHALSAHAWDYLPALKTVFESVGLDYLYHVNDFNKERFYGSVLLHKTKK
jgi:DUF971 family protein